MTDLKKLVKDQIMNEIVHGVKTACGWKVLIVDHEALRMISSCMRMFDLTDNGITIVEDICKSRQPMLDLDAVYLMKPTQANVALVRKDFAGRKKYACAHIFFIDVAPDDVLQGLAHADLKPFVRTASELNLAFVPMESQVFSLDAPDGLYQYYSPYSLGTEASVVAAKLASLCGALGESPVVRYSGSSARCATLGKLVQDRLERLMQYDDTMQQSARTKKSQLLILDRNFDMLSPLVHELTYQAAAYDLLHIEDNTYTYHYEDMQGRTQSKNIVLGDRDPIWEEFKHSHVTQVFKGVSARFKEFTAANQDDGKESGKFGTKELRTMMKNLPQHQEKMGRFSLHLDLADKIMKGFTEAVERATMAEQNMCMGEDADHKKLKDLIGELSDVIVDREVDTNAKLRVLLICIIASGGLDKSDLSRLVDLAEVPYSRRKVLQALKVFDLPVEAEKKGKKSNKPKRRERETHFTLSRWTPICKDIMEDAITGTLSTREYPSVKGTPAPLVETQASGAAVEEPIVSARKRGGWAKKDKKDKAKGDASGASPATSSNPNRLIVFILGSVGYNELRTAYEVSQRYGLDVIIGSHNLASPVQFLTQLEHLEEQRAGQGIGAALESGQNLTFVKGSTLKAGTSVAEI